ncbi:cell division protein SepF, partial [Acrocarpospora phusangensis]|uniref:cell division protein SepF n=1 Tax=Acrocarpospora phusangensis TaxID=1070424 RepID=UPI00195041FE
FYVGYFFCAGTPVVMDLSGLPDSEARQCVDFAAGLVFGRRGDMDRLSPKVFLLMPEGRGNPPSLTDELAQ